MNMLLGRTTQGISRAMGIIQSRDSGVLLSQCESQTYHILGKLLNLSENYYEDECS